jgi:hypothetical protein
MTLSYLLFHLIKIHRIIHLSAFISIIKINIINSDITFLNQQLISSILNENIQFSNHKCRTLRINEALRLMLLIDKGSKENKKGQLPKNGVVPKST